MAAVGLAIFTTLSVHSTYFVSVLPAEVIVSLGMGSLGAALINTIATTATASYLAVHGTSSAALAEGAIHGYTTAFTFSAAVLALATATAFILIRRARAGSTDAETDGTIYAVEVEDPDPLALVTV